MNEPVNTDTAFVSRQWNDQTWVNYNCLQEKYVVNNLRVIPPIPISALFYYTRSRSSYVLGVAWFMYSIQAHEFCDISLVAN